MDERKLFETELQRCLVAVRSQVESVRHHSVSGNCLVEIPESFEVLFKTARAFGELAKTELAKQFKLFDSWVRTGSFFHNHVVAEYDEWLEWLELIRLNNAANLFFWWQSRLLHLDLADDKYRKRNDWRTNWVWHWARARKVFELLADVAVLLRVDETPCFQIAAQIDTIAMRHDCTAFIDLLDSVYLVGKQVEIRLKHERETRERVLAVAGPKLAAFMKEHGVDDAEPELAEADTAVESPPESEAIAELDLHSPPPKFDATSIDWVLGAELAKKIKLSTTTMSDYRKDAFNSDDEHGKWGVDSIGKFRRAVTGNQVGYFVPDLKPSYLSKYTHSKENIGGS